jgi:hypothetical protein
MGRPPVRSRPSIMDDSPFHPFLAFLEFGGSLGARTCHDAASSHSEPPQHDPGTLKPWNSHNEQPV